MSILAKLFGGPKEGREVIHSLDWLKRSPMGENFAFEEIDARARKLIADHPKQLQDMLIIEGHKPLQVALNLIINFCGRDLALGGEHVYRGVLGMDGKEKQKLFLQAQAMMVERGFCTQEDADEGRALMERQVKDAG